MEKIVNHYEMNESTMALLPVVNWNFQTIVLETNKTLLVKQAPLKLIEKTCLTNGASYDGRRTASVYKTKNKYKTPIPISIEKHIYAFPTTSPRNYHCQWLIFNHILDLKQLGKNETLITFSNLQQMKINASYYKIEKQMQRTAHCITAFSNQFQPPFFKRLG